MKGFGTTVLAAACGCMLVAPSLHAEEAALLPVRLGSADAATEIRASYDFFVGGVRIAEVHVGADVDAARYEARSFVVTRGLLDLLLRGRVTSKVSGSRAGSSYLMPETFSSDYETRGSAQTLKIDYESNGPSRVDYDPPEDETPYDIAPDAQDGTLDPLTAAVMALLPGDPGDLCNRTIPVYDGKRRFDIVLLPPEGERFDEEAPPPDWPSPLTRCFGVYERIAGFEPEALDDGRYFPFDIWFEETGNGVFRAVRLAGKTRLGYAIGSLRKE